MSNLSVNPDRFQPWAGLFLKPAGRQDYNGKGGISMRQIAKLFGFLIVVFVLSSGMSFAGSKVFDVDHELYPYYPSLMKWNKSTAQFTPPDTCTGCHSKQYEEWTGSVHALAFQDPVYQGELNRAVKAVGKEVTRQCEGCHSPAGMVTGEIKKPGISGLSPVALAGVSCDICHSVSVKQTRVWRRHSLRRFRETST